MDNGRCVITIDKSGVSIDLKGNEKENITDLIVNSLVESDLEFLEEYPDLMKLSLNGKFSSLYPVEKIKNINTVKLNLSNTMDLSPLCHLKIKYLCVRCGNNITINDIEMLLSEHTEYLELGNSRKICDLSSITKAVNLKKLYLYELPCITTLPDFSKLPFLYALKIYELHKVENIDGLLNSNIVYMDLALFADKLYGTKIAKIILEIKSLKQLNINYIDRSSKKRYDVIYNQLCKNGKMDILNDNMNFDSWKNI